MLGPAMEAFGVRVLYARHADAPPFEVPGVYDREHLAVDMQGGHAPVSTNAVQLAVDLGRFPPGFAPAQGDLVRVQLVDGEAVDWETPPAPTAEIEAYTVADVHRDGERGAVLPLSRRIPDALA